MKSWQESHEKQVQDLVRRWARERNMTAAEIAAKLAAVRREKPEGGFYSAAEIREMVR